MTQFYLVTARKLSRESISEMDYSETCRLVSGREELSVLLQDLQKEESGCQCRFKVEVL